MVIYFQEDRLQKLKEKKARILKAAEQIKSKIHQNLKAKEIAGLFKVKKKWKLFHEVTFVFHFRGREMEGFRESFGLSPFPSIEY